LTRAVGTAIAIGNSISLRRYLSEQRFELTDKTADGIRVIAVYGELDMVSSPRMREALRDAASGATRPLVVDLTDCRFIDSTGLATLLRGVRAASGRRSRAALVSPGGEVRRLLALTAIDQTVPVFASIDDAKRAMLVEDRGGAP
jgi:anti-anti-sigma factor